MNILVLPGDGIGKEVTAQALRVLKEVAGSRATFTEAPIGGEGVKAAGDPLPAATLELAKKADAILFGAVGLPGDELGPRNLRPGGGLLKLRRELALYANFRPAIMYPELVGASSLKPELVEGLDLVVLRELNGDIYYGTPRGISTENGVRVGVNTMRYTEPEIERIAHVGFRAARERRKKLCSVDKANVLETMVLWRETVTKVGGQYPDVELRHLFRGRRVHGAAARAQAVRPHSRAQHVRRHSVGRGSHADRVDRHAAFGVDRRGQQGPIRAGARLGPGHRGPGHRQSARGHPVGGHAAAPQFRPGRGCGAHRAGRARGPGRRQAYRRHIPAGCEKWAPPPWEARFAALHNQGHGRGFDLSASAATTSSASSARARWGASTKARTRACTARSPSRRS
jgi:hypothetical protein